ncbi:LysR family transcriptional regulator [Sedimentibacter sp. B4]|uniref:LysR family transcriptional regulator n=1 Tax=Sedimentibacter sp. B4 TaxID=304766 RepID=UPI0002FCD79F|nr:LysR family transcriptional regulator [Sedimentibacter sp. B4]
MRLDQIEHVIKIAECGSMNKAAKNLYLSQSNLSQSIKNLEEEVGQPIFNRTAKGVELTNFGCEFLNHAMATYSQFRLTQEFCSTYGKNPSLTLSVACQYMRFAHLLFMQLCSKYSSHHTEFSFLECSFIDIVNNVSSHRAEIGILLLSQNHKKITLHLLKSRGLSYHPILACPASVTVGKNSPLYSFSGSGITLDMLKDYPIVMYTDTNFNFSSELEDIEIYKRKNRIIVSDRSTMHEVLQNTNAYSIAAYTNAYKKIEYYDNIRAFELLDDRFSIELGWISSISHPVSELAKEYIGMIEDLQKLG